MDYARILTEIDAEVRPLFGQGRVADYIPALAAVPPHHFGMAVCTVEGDEYVLGDATVPFSIQSLSKVFTLALAMQYEGDALWKRVGREPSGRPFNSLMDLEVGHGIPRNPFMNAGAFVITDCVCTHRTAPLVDLRDFVRRLAGNDAIDYDAMVAASEKAHGHRNAALAHFLKSFDNIHNTVDTVLDVYFHQCSLRMHALDLARSFLFLAHGGRSPRLGDEAILAPRQAKRLNAVMLVGGVYDAVGEFAYRVGMPAKSGVGGGIVAVIPGRLSVCVWSPELDPYGNSLVGTMALELFTTKTGMSIF